MGFASSVPNNDKNETNISEENDQDPIAERILPIETNINSVKKPCKGKIQYYGIPIRSNDVLNPWANRFSGTNLQDGDYTNSMWGMPEEEDQTIPSIPSSHGFNKYMNYNLKPEIPYQPPKINSQYMYSGLGLNSPGIYGGNWGSQFEDGLDQAYLQKPAPTKYIKIIRRKPQYVYPEINTMSPYTMGGLSSSMSLSTLNKQTPRVVNRAISRDPTFSYNYYNSLNPSMQIPAENSFFSQEGLYPTQYLPRPKPSAGYDWRSSYTPPKTFSKPINRLGGYKQLTFKGSSPSYSKYSQRYPTSYSKLYRDPRLQICLRCFQNLPEELRSALGVQSADVPNYDVPSYQMDQDV